MDFHGFDGMTWSSIPATKSSWVWSTAFRLCYSAQAKACTPNLDFAFSWHPLRFGGHLQLSINRQAAKSTKKSAEKEFFPSCQEFAR
jgi:hypothetical protein